MSEILQVKHVSKKIGKKTIIEDINFDVSEGVVFGLVGPNGAGKSTLIKVILGLYKESSGRVIINGYDIQKDSELALEKVGAIIENPEVYSYLSAIENMRIFARMYGKVDEKYIEELLSLVKLSDRKNNLVKTFSLGMKQRLGLAIALLSRPKLLILDEPTNGLDPIGIKELRELIRLVASKQNTAVFISSHILSEIELVCDKIAIIDNGRIIEILEPNNTNKEELLDVIIKVDDNKLAHDLLENAQIKSTITNEGILVNCFEKHIPIIIKSFVEQNISIYEVRKNKKSLEDEFVKITKGSKGQLR